MKNTAHVGIPVSGYQNKYYVSRFGSVFRRQLDGRYRLVKTRIDRAGYLTVRLIQNKVIKTMFVHRLVATTYVANPQDKPFVNHINGNKADNRANNLEWVDHSENIRHAYTKGLINQTQKERRVIDQVSGCVFRSVSEAARLRQIPYSTLKNSLNGNRPNRTELRYVEWKMEAA